MKMAEVVREWEGKTKVREISRNLIEVLELVEVNWRDG